MTRRGTHIGFTIDHMDPLGQGVARDGKAVTFIPATLPGETGRAVVYKKSKGVQFARLDKLERAADNRCEPACPHFSQCPGCHYLHTDYPSELRYKRAALARHLAGLGVGEPDIEVVAAPRRLTYRNRVQLHYRHKYIGMLDPVTNQVVEVPRCQIMHPDLQEAFSALYADKSWTEQHPGHGHCELYLKGGEVSLRWNDSYAHGGFSQVYEEMNEALQSRVHQLLPNTAGEVVLDLFAGSGNLSDSYARAGGERVLVDSFWPGQHDSPANFIKLDLYDEDALRRFIRNRGKGTFNTLLADPPRRGFPRLNAWVKKIRPAQLVYVSCNAASLARDLRALERKFSLESVALLDLFPATYHFETVVKLRFR